MADLKRGTPVRVSFEGKMVGRPHPRLGIARVSVQTEHGTFWAVVPAETIEAIEESK